MHSRRILQKQYNMSFVASIDQSTTSTKFTIYTSHGELVSKHLIEHKQICPNEGWLEHNPLEIIQNVKLCIEKAIESAKSNFPDFEVDKLRGIGVTNQRQTVICWDETGKPYYNAIVWCDNRCKDVCQKFKTKYGEFKNRTGLPISTYFTIFKILWLIENVQEVRNAVQNGNIRFGTIDTWVLYNLTGEYITDASNASRTYLCNLQGEWDEQLLKIAGLSRKMLPTIVSSFSEVAAIKSGVLSGVKICSILGDQQSSAYAHELQINEVKITYGTGCFLLANIGDKPTIHPSFITTIMYKHGDTIQYGYECSVECGGGTLNWAKRAGFFNQYSQLNNFETVSGESLFFFPSFGEIYAPFWKVGVLGGLSGINLSTSRKHIINALLESIIFRVKDNLKDSSFQKVQRIYADGGMTVNERLVQAQADILGKTIIVRQRDTCWGVAKGVLTASRFSLQGFKDQKSHTYSSRAEQKLVLEQKYEKWCAQRAKFYGWQ